MITFTWFKIHDGTRRQLKGFLSPPVPESSSSLPGGEKSCFIYFFDGLRVRTQGFTLAKQAFFCLNHASSLVILEIWSHQLFVCTGLKLQSS
jgi:hypothetical protein